MKTLLLAISMALAGFTLTLAPMDADAKRLGGGRAVGIQRQAPAKPAETTPAKPAQPNNAAPAAPATAGAAAAATGKRSWLAPIAGIAAGLGIAALMSHLGMGEALANIVTMVLLAAVAFIVIRWLMRRFAGGGAQARSQGMQYAGAGAPARDPFAPGSQLQPMQRTATSSDESPGAPIAGARDTTALPGFDAQEFERIAKMIFVRMQAANDSGQLDDLRKFTTPEVFASLRVDLHDRGSVAQQTDVLQLDAQVIEAAQEADQWVVTVRFSGLIREESQAGANPFDELWHFVKPADGSREWAIAGIQQTA